MGKKQRLWPNRVERQVRGMASDTDAWLGRALRVLLGLVLLVLAGALMVRWKETWWHHVPLALLGLILIIPRRPSKAERRGYDF